MLVLVHDLKTRHTLNQRYVVDEYPTKGDRILLTDEEMISETEEIVCYTGIIRRRVWTLGVWRPVELLVECEGNLITK